MSTPTPTDPWERPIPLAAPVIVYPEGARIAGQEGRAIIRAFIDETGTVTQTQVMHTTGYPALDSAAEASVLQMRFRPAQRGVRAEPSQVDVPISFSLS